MSDYTDIVELLGKVVTKITCDTSGDELIFYIGDDTRVKMYHEQDCCESVIIDDICGDLDDLVGFPLLVAEECVGSYYAGEDYEDVDESYTWTFYRFETNKGSVSVRWYGSSNGYYSESVNVLLQTFDGSGWSSRY